MSRLLLNEQTVRRNKPGTKTRILIPTVGKLDVDEIQRFHIEDMVKPLRPILRNRELALASRIFRYFEDQGLRKQYSNPCRGVERSREEPRDRTLTRAEISALGKALANAKVDPVSVQRWITTSDPDLEDMTPLNWLKAGRDADAVLRVAPER